MVKSNNHISNLERATRQSNMDHFFANGKRRDLKGQDHKMSKLTEVDVLEIQSMVGKRSYHETIKKYGISHSQYYRIKNNKSWKHLC